MKNYILSVLVFVGIFVNAAEVEPTNELQGKYVKSIHVNLSGGYYFSVKEGVNNPDKCKKDNWYRLASETYAKDSFELISYAYKSGKKVNFYIDGCYGAHPKVTWVTLGGIDK